MYENILQEGLELMAYGMGIVFIFLTILIIFTNLMSKTIQYLHKRSNLNKINTKYSIKVQKNHSNIELKIIIAAAIHKFRSDKNNV